MLSFQQDSRSECQMQRGKGFRGKTLEFGNVHDLSRGQNNRTTCSMSILSQITYFIILG